MFSLWLSPADPASTAIRVATAPTLPKAKDEGARLFAASDRKGWVSILVECNQRWDATDDMRSWTLLPDGTTWRQITNAKGGLR
jgi:hypothetical protein